MAHYSYYRFDSKIIFICSGAYRCKVDDCHHRRPRPLKASTAPCPKLGENVSDISMPLSHVLNKNNDKESKSHG